jgi:hypothetical protein
MRSQSKGHTHKPIRLQTRQVRLRRGFGTSLRQRRNLPRLVVNLNRQISITRTPLSAIGLLQYKAIDGSENNEFSHQAGHLEFRQAPRCRIFLPSKNIERVDCPYNGEPAQTSIGLSLFRKNERYFILSVNC